MGESNDYAFGTGDFTIECWVNQDTIANEGIYQLTASAGPSTSDDTIWLGPDSYNSTTWFLNVAGDQVRTTSGQGLTANTWYHTAVVRESGKTRLYIDGQLKTFDSGSSFVTDTTDYDLDFLNIGVYYSSSYRFDGKISNFRLVKGTAVYTSNFTPPRAELTNITNTKVLCCQSTSSATAATVSPVTITATGSPTASSQTLNSWSIGTITWPTSITWNGGSAPTLLSVNDYSLTGQVFNLVTADGGTTWYRY